MMMSEIYGALLQFVIILMFSFLMSMGKYDLHLEYVRLKFKQTYFEKMFGKKKKAIQHVMWTWIPLGCQISSFG